MTPWWTSVLFALWCLVVCLSSSEAKDLDVVFSWKEVDFKFASQRERDEALRSGEFIPKNNLPVGIEVWQDKIFLTIPRWNTGVAASLAYINMNDQRDSPLLNPYPNWAAHNLSGLAQGRLVSPFRVRADSCDRLWVIDSGKSDILGEGGRDSGTQPQVLIYDLKTDKLIKNYTLPKDQASDRSFFASIAVDVVNCARTWAYLGDLGDSGLVVYDLDKDKSWRVSHEYFHMDPLETNFNVAGVKFQFKDGLFGLALSEIDSQTTYRTLFFHPFSSANEFQVSTKFLRDEEASKKEEFHDSFQFLGTRGPHTQASASFVDEQSGVLFYTQVNQNAVGCWNYHNGKKYSPSTQALVGANNTTMIFPNDLKVDRSRQLWVLTDKMPMLLFTKQQHSDANYRVLRGSVDQLVQDTVCRPEPESDNISTRFLAGDDAIVLSESENPEPTGQVCRNAGLRFRPSFLLGWTVVAHFLIFITGIIRK